MKYAFKGVFWSIAAFLLVALPMAQAQIRGTSSSGCGTGTGLRNPLRNICSFEDFVELLLQALIRIGLPIAVLFIVYSGFLFVKAQGNETELTKAKSTFLYTVIGVGIFLGSWVLATVVANTVKLLTG